MSEEPRDDYLWNPEAPPDPEVARLEKALAGYRWKERPLRSLDRPRRWRVAAAAAALLLACGVGWWALRSSGAPGPGFHLEHLRGEVGVVGAGGALCQGTEGIRAGDTVRCGPGGKARLRVGPIGSIDLEEKSALRIEEGAAQAYRVYLERGALVASIFAAPRVFQVGTPSGIAVDLGCVYRTIVDEEGRTTLAVLSGRVSFEVPGRKVVVPADASCRAYPGRGPGIPVFGDAPEGFAAAVERLDAGPDAAALAKVLEAARPKDSLTLWHLLEHADAEVRRAAFDRLSRIEAPPEGLRAGAADREGLERWRVQLQRFW
ncbi:MAG TPA: FecR family protein [Planctomycetota bacterium]|nr:FecR family protein [Planctomycetota bacterium]